MKAYNFILLRLGHPPRLFFAQLWCQCVCLRWVLQVFLLRLRRFQWQPRHLIRHLWWPWHLLVLWQIMPKWMKMVLTIPFASFARMR